MGGFSPGLPRPAWDPSPTLPTPVAIITFPNGPRRQSRTWLREATTLVQNSRMIMKEQSEDWRYMLPKR